MSPDLLLHSSSIMDTLYHTLIQQQLLHRLSAFKYFWEKECYHCFIKYCSQLYNREITLFNYSLRPFITLLLIQTPLLYHKPRFKDFIKYILATDKVQILLMNPNTLIWQVPRCKIDILYLVSILLQLSSLLYYCIRTAHQDTKKDHLLVKSYSFITAALKGNMPSNQN